MSIPFDVGGPVRAEVFVVTQVDGKPVLTGPDGPTAWHIETHGSTHPMDEIRSILEAVLGHVTLFHSTSWRWDHDSVVLTFLAVIPGPIDMTHLPVDRAEIARGESTEAPTAIEPSQVLEHALRHLAWLAKEDPTVAGVLDETWHDALAGYIPAPFRQLEREADG